MPVTLCGEQRVGQRGERRKVQVGKQDEVLAEVPVLLLDGLLDLDDHLGEPPDVMGGADDLGAGRLVFVVGHRGERACVVLDENLVSCFHQGLCACWSDAYAALVVFDFLRHADNHSFSP